MTLQLTSSLLPLYIRVRHTEVLPLLLFTVVYAYHVCTSVFSILSDETPLDPLSHIIIIRTRCFETFQVIKDNRHPTLKLQRGSTCSVRPVTECRVGRSIFPTPETTRPSRKRNRPSFFDTESHSYTLNRRMCVSVCVSLRG